MRGPFSAGSWLSRSHQPTCDRRQQRKGAKSAGRPLWSLLFALCALACCAAARSVRSACGAGSRAYRWALPPTKADARWLAIRTRPRLKQHPFHKPLLPCIPPAGSWEPPFPGAPCTCRPSIRQGDYPPPGRESLAMIRPQEICIAKSFWYLCMLWRHMLVFCLCCLL